MPLTLKSLNKHGINGNPTDLSEPLEDSKKIVQNNSKIHPIHLRGHVRQSKGHARFNFANVEGRLMFITFCTVRFSFYKGPSINPGVAFDSFHFTSEST